MESEIAFSFEVMKFHFFLSFLKNRETEILGIGLLSALDLTLSIRSRVSYLIHLVVCSFKSLYGQGHLCSSIVNQLTFLVYLYF